MGGYERAASICVIVVNHLSCHISGLHAGLNQILSVACLWRGIDDVCFM